MDMCGHVWTCMHVCTFVTYLLQVDLEEEAGVVVPQHGRDLVVPCSLVHRSIGRLMVGG